MDEVLELGTEYRYHFKGWFVGKGCGCVHPRPTKAFV